MSHVGCEGVILQPFSFSLSFLFAFLLTPLKTVSAPPRSKKSKTVAAQKREKNPAFLGGGGVSSFFKIQQLIGDFLRIQSIVFPRELGFLFIYYFFLLHFRAIPVPSSSSPCTPHVVRRSGKEQPFPPPLPLPPWCQTGVKVACLEGESEVENTYEWGEAHITISPFFAQKKLKNQFNKSFSKNAPCLFPFPADSLIQKSTTINAF